MRNRSALRAGSCVALVAVLVVDGACVGLQDLGDRPAADGGSSDPRASDDGDAGSTTPSSDAANDAPSITPNDTVLVTGGSFRYATPSGSVGQTRLTYDFWIDVHEVTVERLEAWEKAGRPAPCADACSLDPGGPYAADMRWNPAREPELGEKDYVTADPLATYGRGSLLPVNLVNWYQATAICAFEGKRLLTDTEWQYVAAAGDEGRTYPWGSEPPTDCADAIWGKGGNVATPMNGCSFPLNVGTAAGDTSRHGARDLGGSVSEWVWDVPRSSSTVPAQLPDNPIRATEFSSGQTRTVRGGAFFSLASGLTSLAATDHAPGSGSVAIGFRCAKTKQ